MSTSAIEIRATENCTTNTLFRKRIVINLLERVPSFYNIYQVLILTFPCLLSYCVTLTLIFKYSYKTNMNIYIFHNYIFVFIFIYFQSKISITVLKPIKVTYVCHGIYFLNIFTLAQTFNYWYLKKKTIILEYLKCSRINYNYYIDK